MQGFDQLVGRDADLSPEEYRHIEVEVLKSARQVRVARLLFGNPLGPLGLGVQVHGYDALSEMSAAILSMAFEDDEDIISKARTNLPIPINAKTFKIQRRDLESSRRFGTPLDAQNAEAAAYQVGVKEEGLLIQGWSMDGTTYQLEGLYQAADQDYSTAASFATAGKPISALGGAMALLLAQNVLPPYNCILHPTQYGELVQSIYTGGVDEFSKFSTMLGGNPKSTAPPPQNYVDHHIFPSAQLTAGKGLVLATPNRGFMKLVIAQDVMTEYWDEKKKATMGRVFECLIPRITDKNSLCRMSDI